MSKAIFDAEALRSFLDSQLIERKASANLIWKAMKKQKIQRLEKFIAAHKAIISAIRRIPPEIIQDIFQWLSAILRDGWEANSKSEPKWALPFAYGQICSSWRSSALSVYSLWSLFPDIRKPKSRVGNELQLKYMTELLRRSRQSPIQFSFDAALWNRDPYPTADLLIQSSERWQVIEISGTAMGIYKYFHTILGRIPNLERLTISVVMFDGDSDVLDMFQVAPKLRKVQLSGHRIDDIKLPNYQLVDFTSVVVHARNPLSQLTNAHHLEILYYESRSPGPITNVNMISLPSLKRLFVVLHQSFPPVLDFLTVPILEGLHITDLLNVLDSALLRSIVGMASRSGNLPHLQELHIWSTLDEMPEGLDEILRLTPALRLLDTPIPSPHDILAIASTKMGSLPLVSSLEFCYFGATKVLAPEIFSAMKEFTDSRCELLHQYDTPLRGLSLTTNCGQWWNTTTSQGDAGNHVRVIRQSQLELWQASDTSALLTVLKMRLFGFVSGLSTRNPVFPDQPFKGSWFQNMQNLLDEIKNVEVDDGIDILVSLSTFPSVNNLSKNNEDI